MGEAEQGPLEVIVVHCAVSRTKQQIPSMSLCGDGGAPGASTRYGSRIWKCGVLHMNRSRAQSTAPRLYRDADVQTPAAERAIAGSLVLGGAADRWPGNMEGACAAGRFRVVSELALYSSLVIDMHGRRKRALLPGYCTENKECRSEQASARFEEQGREMRRSSWRACGLYVCVVYRFRG